MTDTAKVKNKLQIGDLFDNTNQYNIEIILPFSKQTLKMREMITSDQKEFLKSASNLNDKDYVQRKIGVLFNTLLEKICEDLDVSTMTLQDKLYVLLFLRTRLRGDKTELNVTCEKCKKTNKITYSLERFTKKVNAIADSLDTPKICDVAGTTMTIDAIMIKEEIENDTLLSDEKWVKNEEIAESEISNLLRVASAIKIIKIPSKGEVDMTEYHMRERYDALMRMPATMMTEIVDSISTMLKTTFDITEDVITVPCLQEGCNGKTEVTIQMGDEGFFIKPSSD